MAVIDILIIIWLVRHTFGREYRAARDHHAAKLARAHPDWHGRKVSRAASRRTLGHWLNELNSWPPFPSFREAFGEDRMAVKVAAAEAKAQRMLRWRDLSDRLGRATSLADEVKSRRAAGVPPEGIADDPPLGPFSDTPPAPSSNGTSPEPGAPLSPRLSDWLKPGQPRCEGCGGTGSNRTGSDSCPACRGFGSGPGDPAAPEAPDGTICEACGRPAGPGDPVLADAGGPVHRSHVIEMQESYREGLAHPGTINRRPRETPPDDDPFPEPEDDWPTGIPHRRNGDAPSPEHAYSEVVDNMTGLRQRACTCGWHMRGFSTENGARDLYDAHLKPSGSGSTAAPASPAPEGANQEEGEPVTATDFDTALESADTPHEAMQNAFRAFGASAQEIAQAASDDLVAAAAVHGMDRDPQTMADITEISDQAGAIKAKADAAASGLAARHAEGAEYHGTGSDAHASAFRPA
jgi:hypothetical protein